MAQAPRIRGSLFIHGVLWEPWEVLVCSKMGLDWFAGEDSVISRWWLFRSYTMLCKLGKLLCVKDEHFGTPNYWLARHIWGIPKEIVSSWCFLHLRNNPNVWSTWPVDQSGSLLAFPCFIIVVSMCNEVFKMETGGLWVCTFLTFQ